MLKGTLRYNKILIMILLTTISVESRENEDLGFNFDEPVRTKFAIDTGQIVAMWPTTDKETGEPMVTIYTQSHDFPVYDDFERLLKKWSDAESKEISKTMGVPRNHSN